MSDIPEDIFQTACGIVMNARSLKSVSRHTDVVDAVAAALLLERETANTCEDCMGDAVRIRERAFNAGWNLAGGDFTQQDAYQRWLRGEA